MNVMEKNVVFYLEEYGEIIIFKFKELMGILCKFMVFLGEYLDVKCIIICIDDVRKLCG